MKSTIVDIVAQSLKIVATLLGPILGVVTSILSGKYLLGLSNNDKNFSRLVEELLTFEINRKRETRELASAIAANLASAYPEQFKTSQPSEQVKDSEKPKNDELDNIENIEIVPPSIQIARKLSIIAILGAQAALFSLLTLVFRDNPKTVLVLGWFSAALWASTGFAGVHAFLFTQKFRGAYTKKIEEKIRSMKPQLQGRIEQIDRLFGNQ
jgi:hypothetical protein